MGFGSWLSRKIFKPAQRFLGKAVKGVGVAGRFLGKKILPVIQAGSGIVRDIASNPLVQAGANAILPGSGVGLMGLASGAAFVNSSTRAAPAIYNQFASRNPQQIGQGLENLADLQNQYQSLRK